MFFLQRGTGGGGGSSEILPNIVDCLNPAADFLTPFSTLIPANTFGIHSEPLNRGKPILARCPGADVGGRSEARSGLIVAEWS